METEKKIVIKKVSESSFDYNDASSMFRDIKDKVIQNIWIHQGEILDEFHKIENTKKDIAIELPTGSGKTLVGLLLAEWRRRKFNDKVIYLCPTKQLANQVAEKSKECGLHSYVLIGEQKNYPASQVADWQASKNIVITTYSALFNTNPRLSNPDVIILDDAHSAENHFSNFWSMNISRDKETLYMNLVHLFRNELNDYLYDALISESVHPTQKQSVDLLPQPYFYDKKSDLIAIIETFIASNPTDSLKYSWEILKPNLNNLHIYFSWSEILFRPWITPTLTHLPFSNSKMRIYMSATFGKNGDLERMIGIKDIHKIKLPRGWEKQSTGRKLFIFLDRNFSQEEYSHWLKNRIGLNDRTLVVTPNKFLYDDFKKKYNDSSQFKLLISKDIEHSLKNFTDDNKAVLLLNGRYDGIDLPGESCRFLLIYGLPKGINLQEQFFWSKLNMRNIIINERIRTRLTQASGRCTRNSNDFAVIVMVSQEVLDFCNSFDNRKYLHPELRAEIEFGLDNSDTKDFEHFDLLIDMFLKKSDQWKEDCETDILERRNKNSREIFQDEHIKQIEEISSKEINYQYLVWKNDYVKALEIANQIADIITDRQLDGFRSSWYYHAGCCAFHLAKITSDNSYLKIASEKFKRASISNPSINWFHRLSYRVNPIQDDNFIEQLNNLSVYGKIGDYIESLGFIGKKFEKHNIGILESIKKINDANIFDSAVEAIGKMLGFTSFRPKLPSSPDIIWKLNNDFTLIFETKLNLQKNNVISTTTCRQAGFHEKWVEETMPLYKSNKIYTVIISSASFLDPHALAFIENLYYLNTADMIKLAESLINLYREIRSKMDGIDIIDRDKLIRKRFEDEKLSFKEIIELFIKTKIADLKLP